MDLLKVVTWVLDESYAATRGEDPAMTLSRQKQSKNLIKHDKYLPSG